ncbi:MAG: hypothetical protein F4Y79_15675 [Gemmatimonadetes bacterium]|nr:hypothetical protein [Gemmatimonadota bacterium]MYF17694.1 hypothetical protein [Gemmatimonadota bacterium]
MTIPDLHIHQIIKTVACLFVFMLITSFTHAYAQSQQFVGQGSYTGTLNENRSTKVSAEVTNKIVLNNYDITDASLSNHYYITGTLLNDSYGGVYDITLTFFWKDAAGNDLGTERVYTIVGLPANIRSSIFDIEEDYIPPLEKGYFYGLVEIPENAVVENSEYIVVWTWTLQAHVNTDVKVLDNTVSISDVNFIGYRDVTGTVHNGLTETLEYVEVFAIVLLSDGTVADIESTYIATSQEYMLPLSQKDFSLNIRPLFGDGNDIQVLTYVSFRFLNENAFYTNADDDRAFVIPRDTITVTVRDTVYINAGGPSTQLLGDLNSDGVVNVADFLIFVENFGKTASVSEQPEHPPVKKYSSCTEMRVDWPKGVNKNGGTYSEAWNDAEKRTYEMNSANLDRDKDSHACEDQ